MHICKSRVTRPERVDEGSAVSALPAAAQLKQFCRWLNEHEPASGLTARRLFALYVEWAEFADVAPLTKGQFFQKRRAAGIERYREPVGERRWRYQVPAPDVDPANRVVRLGFASTDTLRRRI